MIFYKHLLSPAPINYLMAQGSFRKITSPSGAWGAVLLLIAGVIMAFVALFLPPPGEIHDSVLYIFAQILIYAGSIFGVSAYIDKKTHPSSPVRREGE